MGGGYTGAAVAVQLARAMREAVEIAIVEPREELGRGVAYSTADPDHRLNGPLDNHILDPGEPDHLRQWCERRRLFERDPEALAANGAIYLRRGDFGAYVSDAIREVGRHTRITHHRARAERLRQDASRFAVLLATGEAVDADAVVIATGNGAAAWPRPFRSVSRRPAAIADPFEAARLAAVPRDARVLLVGSGLTALDVATTLLRQGHTGRIGAISRHGVRPRPPRADMSGSSVVAVLARIEGEIPAYAEQALARGRVLDLARALRRRIEETRAQGGDWQVPFDHLRDVVWRFWPRLELAQKRRFLRHLRVWYDAHRFRTPPQNALIAAEAERRGQLVYETVRLADADAFSATFDVVVNCSGLDPACGATDNPFLASLVAAGRIRPHATGFGFDVDAQCRPLDRAGNPSSRVRMVGPPTAGVFGDPLGVIFIAPQVRRMLPGLLGELRLARAAPPAAAPVNPPA